MTKFDPNATPDCNRLETVYRNFGGGVYPLVDLDDAKRLERRARIADEKLRIAVEGLKDIGDYNSNWMMSKILEEIERVGRE